MTTQHANKDLRSLWQGQPTTVVQMTPDQLRARASKFQSRIKWRNGREYVASAIVIVCYSISIGHFQTMLPRLGFAMVILWAIYLVYCMHRFASSASLPSDVDTQNRLAFHRRQLEKQRDFARAWPWGLVPSIPGFVLAVIGMHIEQHRDSGWEQPIAMIGIFAFLLIAIAIHNKWTADRWQREIDSLESMSTSQ